MPHGLGGAGPGIFDIGFEYVAVHRAIDDQGRGDPVVTQGGDEGCRFPMPMRNRGEEPFAFAGATTKPGHFVDAPVSSMKTDVLDQTDVALRAALSGLR